MEFKGLTGNPKFELLLLLVGFFACGLGREIGREAGISSELSGVSALKAESDPGVAENLLVLFTP